MSEVSTKTKPFSNTPFCVDFSVMHWFNLFLVILAVWFSNLSKRLKLRLQAWKNKCIRFCLQLDKRSKIHVKEFLQLNWLNVHDKYLQFTVSDNFQFQNDQCPDYFDDLFSPIGENGVITRSSSQKFKLLFQKTKLILCGT